MKTTRFAKYLGALWCAIGGPLLVLPSHADSFVGHSNVEHSNVESVGSSFNFEDGSQPSPIIGPPPPLSSGPTITPISVPFEGSPVGLINPVVTGPTTSGGNWSGAPAPSIPEPTTAALLLIGLIGVVRRSRRR